MSKLTSAIDAKSLVIGVLLTVIVFMSMGATTRSWHYVKSEKITAYNKTVRGIPFQRDDDGTVWFYN